MFELLLKRKVFEADYTEGRLYSRTDDSQRWTYLMDTLEPHAIDWLKEKKTMGRTAIPEGRYTMGFTTSKKFGELTPYLQCVPHFTGILMHPGNTVADTRGCILVGMRDVHHPGMLVNSRHCFEMLQSLLWQNTSPAFSWKIKIL